MTEKERAEGPEAMIAEGRAEVVYERIAQQKITSPETYTLMGELIKEVQKVINRFEKEAQAKIDESHKLHKALEKFKTAEQLGKDKLAHYIESYQGNLPSID